MADAGTDADVGIGTDARQESKPDAELEIGDGVSTDVSLEEDTVEALLVEVKARVSATGSHFS